MKIGIFGGAFDPPHKGHQELLSFALHELRLDQLLVVPSGQGPWKTHHADAQHRLKMCELEFDSLLPVVQMDSIEILRAQTAGGPTYTYDLLKQLQTRYQDPRGDDLYFLLGSDSFMQIDQWKNYPDLIELCQWRVYIRQNAASATTPEQIGQALASKISTMPLSYQKRIQILPFSPIGVSSSDIRRSIALTGTPPPGSIQASTLNYLTTHALYGATSNIPKIKEM
jgi:nicotinate-nucleotide adenylyltransferase